MSKKQYWRHHCGDEQALGISHLEAIKQGHVGMDIDLDIASFSQPTYTETNIASI